MATQGNIQVPPDSTGKRVDAASLDDASNAVYRQKMVITGHSGTAEVAQVVAAAASADAMGLVVRHAGTATVAGVVGLTAGTANIGFINNISATVQVAIGTPFTVNNISATSIVAGALNISGSVEVSGSINIFTTGEVQSASRGPRCVIASTSANVTLIAAPGAGLSIFVTHVAVSNAAGSNTRARVGTSATIGAVTMMLAASGGGYVMQFTPPWQLSANEAALCSVKPNASEGIFNVHFFVGSADAF